MAKGWLQRGVKAAVSPATSAAMEAESREWMVRCGKCGWEISIWDLGGVRAGAKGSTWTFGRCRECRKFGWFKLYRRRAPEPAPETPPPGEG